MSEVQDFDLARKVVKLPDGEVAYDYLIVASGASHAYFGHDEWEPFAPGLKTIEDALEIRRRVLLAFELAERQAASGKEQVQLNFVVVGGGPTGVELAGTLAEIARRALANEFRTIDPRKTRIVLLEGGPRILPAYPEDLSRSAEEQLRRLGVEVHTSALVTGVSAGRSADGRNALAGRGDSLGGGSCGLAAGEKAGSAGGPGRTGAGESRPQPAGASGSLRDRRSGRAQGRERKVAAGGCAGRHAGRQSHGAQHRG